MENKLRILKLEPGKLAYVKEISNDLESLQAEVGGFIERVCLDDDTSMIVNEEGKLEGLSLHRVLKDENGEIYDAVAGPAFLVRDVWDDEDFTSLTDEQIAKWGKTYKYPCDIFLVGRDLMAFPFNPEAF